LDRGEHGCDERRRDIGSPVGAGEGGLRLGIDGTGKGRCDEPRTNLCRDARRQERTLVVSTRNKASGVEGHRHEDVGPDPCGAASTAQ
jgi:hypothetical protein